MKMTPPQTDIDEARIREEIEQQLIEAGCVIQDKKRLDLYKSLRVAVRKMDSITPNSIKI